jgi:hypothetical protein
VAEAIDGTAVGQSQVTLCPLQRLNMWLFIDTDYDGFFGRIQIQADHVGGFRAELGICRHAVTAISWVMPRSAAQIDLTAEEEATLRQWSRQGTAEQRMVERSRVILLSQEGLT